MNITFVSLNGDWIHEISKRFPGNTVICDTVEKIPREDTVFVSPTNSLGFMDGGIDWTYSRRMFPGCEETVKSKMKSYGYYTFIGRPYVPVGAAFCISVGETTGLICAPTMFHPTDVSTTRNAYWSFLAALLVWKKTAKYKTMVVTSHCCGVGKMAPEISAQQMLEAFEDFQRGTFPEDLSKDQTMIDIDIQNEESDRDTYTKEIIIY
jgi:O-acetyl-ADP-ribose deacetylase (regulator of RNase III)